ncbi:MAG: carbon-nitrogen hydrolase family protein [Oscillospiraceae bacterium]
MFQVAMLQLVPGKTQEENLQKGIDYCKKAKRMGADLALFPELWNIGYNIDGDVARWQAEAVSRDSDFVRAFASLAKELDMAIAVTYLEKYDPLPRNTVTVFDRFGSPILTYAKLHTCDFDKERHMTPGDDFYVAELQTEGDTIKIGCMICYDREFPESARILMLKGAEVILVPNACPMEINRLSQLRARAYENMVGIATANYAIGKEDCNGHSTAFDGIAYGPDTHGKIAARDTLIVEAGEEEGIYLAPFPMEKIRNYRAEEVHGNAYRHPAKYKVLTEEKIEKPFVRADYRK